jgi:glutamine synthetase
MFLRTDCVFVPACLVAYTGLALDEKTPLHRAEFALSREGKRLFGLLGHPIAGLKTHIGLEQELFFVPSAAYYKRPDLMCCQRTVMGNAAALGQEASTHYMAPINTSKSVFACMQVRVPGWR